MESTTRWFKVVHLVDAATASRETHHIQNVDKASLFLRRYISNMSIGWQMAEPKQLDLCVDVFQVGVFLFSFGGLWFPRFLDFWRTGFQIQIVSQRAR